MHLFLFYIPLFLFYIPLTFYIPFILNSFDNEKNNSKHYS